MFVVKSAGLRLTGSLPCGSPLLWLDLLEAPTAALPGLSALPPHAASADPAARTLMALAIVFLLFISNLLSVLSGPRWTV